MKKVYFLLLITCLLGCKKDKKKTDEIPQTPKEQNTLNGNAHIVDTLAIVKVSTNSLSLHKKNLFYGI
jgi:hypothetical protein